MDLFGSIAILALVLLAGIWAVRLLKLFIRISGAAHARKTATSDVSDILEAGLPFAKQMLAEHGVFYAFAFAMSNSGGVTAVAVDFADEFPASQRALEELIAALRAGATSGDYRACGLFTNVQIELRATGEPIVAIRAGLEHMVGYCIDVYVPYALSEEGTLTCEQSFISKRKALVFKQCRSWWRAVWLRAG